MSTYIALLRAVNVGGTGKLAMADLRKLLNGLGFRHVQTYIQSGNAVFETGSSAAAVRRELTAALEERMGAGCGVVLRTHEDLCRVIAANPFAVEAAADGTKVHVGFFAGVLGEGVRAALEAIAAKYAARRDRFHVGRDVIYFHFPDGAAETKFSGKTLQRAAGEMGTARNWNTVLKLHAMSAPGRKVEEG